MYSFDVVYGNILGTFLDSRTRKFVDAVVSIVPTLHYRSQCFKLPHAPLFERLKLQPVNFTQDLRLSPLGKLPRERLIHQLSQHGAYHPQTLDAHRVKFTMTEMPTTSLDTPFVVYNVLVITSVQSHYSKFLETSCLLRGFQFAFRCAADDMKECSPIRFGMKSWENGKNQVVDAAILRGKRVSLETARRMNLIPHVPVGNTQYIHKVEDMLLNLGQFYVEGVDELQTTQDLDVSIQAVRRDITKPMTSMASIDITTTPTVVARKSTPSDFSLDL